MKNDILVYDFETVSKDATTTVPCQLGACVINGKTLEIKPNTFVSYIKPWDESVIDPDTVAFHAKHRKCSKEEILEKWSKAPESDLVLQQFIDYASLHAYNKSKVWDFPLRAGFNIINFDDIILQRWKVKFGKEKALIFHPRDSLDVLNISYLWLHSLPEPKTYSLDTLREFFGMSQESKDNAHDALGDVIDTANLLIRFLKLHQHFATKVKFKGSFANGV